MSRVKSRKVKHSLFGKLCPPLYGSISVAAAVMSCLSSARADNGSTDATSGPGLEEIVVTARKREEDAQHIPLSIEVLGPATLDAHQVQSFDDYVKLLPSVSFQSFGPGQSQIYFRGISSAGDGLHSGSLPTTGLYLDEMPVTTIGGNVDLHVYDMQRIEAISGPQGTLFGASSLSGTLRLITNKPDSSKFEAGYQVQGDKYGDGGGRGGTVDGYVNLPIIDGRAAIRIVAFGEHDGGYINNVAGTRTYTFDDITPPASLTVNNSKYAKRDFNDVDTYGGRAALKVDLDDNWTIMPAVVYENQTANGTFLYDPKKGFLNVTDYTPDVHTDHWYQASLTIQGKIGDWNATYVGGLFHRQVESNADYSYYTVAYDAVPAKQAYVTFTDAAGHVIDPTQDTSTNDVYGKETDEVRVTSPADYRVRGIVGAFYQKQTDRGVANYYVPGVSTSQQSAEIVIPGAPNPDDIFLNDILRIDRDYAVYADGSVDILPNLTLDAGVRGFYDDNTILGFTGFDFLLGQNAVTGLPCGADATAVNCPNVNAKQTDRGQTHKVTLSWTIAPDKLLYATYSTGFRPGGNNRNGKPFAPDTLVNYEVGWKTTWDDKRVRINGDIFVDNWDNLQYGLSPINSQGELVTYDAGNARVYGLESNLQWLATERLTLTAAATYIDAKLTTNFCDLDAQQNELPTCSAADNNIAAPKGTPLPIQPRVKLNGLAQYTIPMGSYKSFVQGAILNQSSARQYLSLQDSTILGPTKGFTTFDFALGFVRDTLSAELFIQNAFDAEGELSKNTVCVVQICGAYARIYPIKPQMFGFKVAQRF